jgi:hypothetical protein
MIKAIGSILILMIVVHSQCGVQCLSEAFGSPLQKPDAGPAEQPPCHQHAQDSSTVPSHQDSSRHDHDKGNSCGQAQTVEFKIAPISQAAFEWEAVDFHVSTFSLEETAIPRRFRTRIDASFHANSTAQPTVLRI